MNDIGKTTTIIRENWSNPLGLITSILLISVILLSTLPKVANSYIFIISLDIIIFLCWYIGRKPKKIPKNTVSVQVAINSIQPESNLAIRADFISSLRREFDTLPQPSNIHFSVALEHDAKKIDGHQAALDYLNNSNINFLIYGDAKISPIYGSDTHILNISALVKHDTLPEIEHKAFTKEFTEIFPREAKIARNNPHLGFEITSKFTDLAVKYILGITTALSENYVQSEALFLDVLRKTSNNQLEG